MLRHRYIIAIVISLLPVELCAQPGDKTEGTSLVYGAIGLGAIEPGIGGLAELTITQDALSFSATGHGGGTVNIFGNNESIGWLSVSVGYQFLSSPFNARIVAGPCYYSRSFDTSNLFGGGGHSVQNGYGANAEVDAIFFHSKYFGLGAQFAAMLSSQKTFFGLTLNLLVGKLE